MSKEKQPHIIRQLAWIRENSTQETLKLHQEPQLRQSLDILNQLINENAYRPQSIHLLRKILRERAALHVTQHDDETSLSG